MGKRIFQCLILFLAVSETSCLRIPDLPQEPPFSISAESPQGIYAVKVERKRKPFIPSNEPWSWKLFLGVSRQGQQSLSNEVVGAGDDSTNTGFPPFQVPELNWVSENIFRLAGKENSPHLMCDILFVRNKTDKTLSYFNISGHGDMFFVLDLSPGETVKLYAQPQTTGLGWISGHGRLADGKQVSGGRNFSIHNLYEGPSYYCLTINEDQVVIVSREFEGWTLSDRKEVIIPRALDCGSRESK
jgi:hypothetical protein